MFQMLVRGANAVGYTNYPDNVVAGFVKHAAQSCDVASRTTTRANVHRMSLLSKLTQVAKSEKGKELIGKAQAIANDPGTAWTVCGPVPLGEPARPAVRELRRPPHPGRAAGR